MSRHTRRLPASERRAQLIEVGRSVFAKHGFSGTSVEEIAKRAHVSKPIVYEHFGGKEGLYAVIVDREMDYVSRRITEAISTGTPRERVEQASITFLRYVKDHPDGFAVLSQDSPLTSSRGTMSSLLNDMAERVGSVFASTLKDAGYDPKAAPIFAHGLIGMVTFVGKWWTEARKPAVEDVAKHISTLAWMGLRHLPTDTRSRRVRNKAPAASNKAPAASKDTPSPAASATAKKEKKRTPHRDKARAAREKTRMAREKARATRKKARASRAD